MLKLQELCFLHLLKPINLFLSDGGRLCELLPLNISDSFFTMLASRGLLSDNHIKYWTKTLIKDFDCTGCEGVTNVGIKLLISRFGDSIEGLRFVIFVAVMLGKLGGESPILREG